MFGIQGHQEELQEGAKVNNPLLLAFFLVCLSGFPLVSDGPMVQDLCNETKRKLPYGLLATTIDKLGFQEAFGKSSNRCVCVCVCERLSP